jgi:polar amino acid transport system substrate-binding protein
MTRLRFIRPKLLRHAGSRFAAAAAMLAFWLLAVAVEAKAQPLRVAVYDAAPYASVARDGSFTGASVDLWRRVAEDIGRNYQFILVSSMEDVLRGIEQGRFDAAIGAITITENRAARVDFSYPAHRSGVAAALRKEVGTRAAIASFSTAVFELGPLFGVIIALLFVAGIAMWIVERLEQDASKADSAVRSLRDGLYWAVVTMTTVGYGDKTPKTTLGLIVATLWMLSSLALVSLLSASLVSRLTAEQVGAAARFGHSDLWGKRVAAAAASSGAEYLEHHRIAHRNYASLQEALEALAAGREEVVINSVGALRFLVATRFAKSLRVADPLLAPTYMAIALPEHSALKKPLDRALMRITESPEWRQAEEGYFAR